MSILKLGFLSIVHIFISYDMKIQGKNVSEPLIREEPTESSPERSTERGKRTEEELIASNTDSCILHSSAKLL